MTRSLGGRLDVMAAAGVNPGRTETFRRLTRFEYQNAVRDLLGVEIDATTLLPPDESSRGFDNITVTGLSPTLLTRYIAAARKVSRLAVGRTGGSPIADTFRVRPDVTQDVRVDGLPPGTRGGLLIPYTFSQDGEYEVQVHLMRDRNSNVEGLKESHTLEVLLDREQVAEFKIAPVPSSVNDKEVDANLKTRITATAGRHDVGVTFVAKGSPLLESTRKPLNVHFNFYRHPRLGPAVYEVSILGPMGATETKASQLSSPLLAERPGNPAEAEACAQRTLSAVLRRAYRRPVTKEDLERPMNFFRQGLEEGSYEAGLDAALTSILVSPQFLFRIEYEPKDVKRATAYSISDLELASRMSFFLWSSIPDEELLELAEAGKLRQPEVLDQQVRRMLQDERSRALVTNFAGQWLHLRNLEAVTPDGRLYPDFDDNLRQAMRTETDLFVESVLREDRSVLDLLRADHTFLNERLAKHYGISNVYGPHFRRVTLDRSQHRGGLLRQGSVLTVTSYATRTSPVLRGKWVLENLLSSPPAPPPENVPALTDNTVSAALSVRERLAQHRAHEACAACHDRIDPIGLALENFDAVGRWRDREEGKPVDASGGLFPGRDVNGVDELETALLDYPELFTRTVTEKLMTYAL
ncbi:MAG TPA: DUF1592 domain-containing protein, partial [Caulifigura sp.]|nr:DUF1592 domain-containing protein [Caulifigura sp.]